MLLLPKTVWSGGGYDENIQAISLLGGGCYDENRNESQTHLHIEIVDMAGR